MKSFSGTSAAAAASAAPPTENGHHASSIEGTSKRRKASASSVGAVVHKKKSINNSSPASVSIETSSNAPSGISGSSEDQYEYHTAENERTGLRMKMQKDLFLR